MCRGIDPHLGAGRPAVGYAGGDCHEDAVVTEPMCSNRFWVQPRGDPADSGSNRGCGSRYTSVPIRTRCLAGTMRHTTPRTHRWFPLFWIGYSKPATRQTSSSAPLYRVECPDSEGKLTTVELDWIPVELVSEQPKHTTLASEATKQQGASTGSYPRQSDHSRRPNREDLQLGTTTKVSAH